MSSVKGDGCKMKLVVSMGTLFFQCSVCKVLADPMRYFTREICPLCGRWVITWDLDLVEDRGETGDNSYKEVL